MSKHLALLVLLEFMFIQCYTDQASSGEILRFDNINLSAFDPAIGDMKNIAIISANQNKITELPESFAQLNKLEELHLERNQIDKFPQEILKMNSP